MKIEFSDAWLLQSIYHSERENEGSMLKNMVAYADYVNHAIMTFEEFKEGLYKLIALDLIKEKGENLTTTEQFKIWWDKKFGQKKRIYNMAELEQIKVFLDKTVKNQKPSVNFQEIVIKTTEIDFNKAVTDYLQLVQKK
jgi:hypothetical protein